jgi:predicted nucleic acid-binding protein
MKQRVMLDSTPLGKLCKPTPRPEILLWRNSIIAAGWELIIPEIADYEVRRNLLLESKFESIALLDGLKTTLLYQPITTPIMLKAAELWADARRRGKPTADPKELDADVILAAMAIETKAVIATENVGHLDRYTTARHWSAIVVARQS